jgi:hypothetical protein
METTMTLDLEIEATDLSGQKAVTVNQIPDDASVAELIDELRSKMRLPGDDAEGRPVSYHALLEREGRHLHAGERARDVLEPRDRIVIQPSIDAGAI